MTDRSDADIVADVIAGDVEAFRLLIRRYSEGYARFAVRLLGSRDDADDALQLAFVRAYRNLSKCHDPARFGAWLFQIVLNECRTYAARRMRRESRIVRDEAHLLRVPSGAEGPGGAPDGMDDVQHQMQQALNHLDPLYREAFLLKYVEDMKYEDMAELTGTGVSALKMRVKRAGDQLRTFLGGRTNG